MPVGPGAVLDALEAVNVARVGTREDFYWTLHAVFVKRHEHPILFDQAFRIFFRRRGYIDRLIAAMLPEMLPTAPKEPQPGAQRIQEALFAGTKAREQEEQEVEIDARLTVSDREVLQKKDFAQMTTVEIAAAKEGDLEAGLAARSVKTRRIAAARRGHVIDIRRTLRGSMKSGGAMIDLKYLGPREKEPPIVALFDISGSMSQYTRLFLHFLHAITDERKRVTTFLFGTRLTNVTRAIRSAIRTRRWRPAGRMSSTGRAALVSPARCMTSTSIGRGVCSARVRWCCLITDGLERDADDTLGFEMDRLHRSCRRLIWLNPLLRFDGFEPRAKGVQTMLGHVDELRPMHNLEIDDRTWCGRCPARPPRAMIRNKC